MEKFGEPFKIYTPFRVDHVSFPAVAKNYRAMANLGVKVNRNELMVLKPRSPYMLTRGKPVEMAVLTSDDFSNGIREELKKVIVQVAPTARVYPISPEQPDLSDLVKKTMPFFDYYFVEFGLNVALGREAKVPNLKFIVKLSSDGADDLDVTAYSVAPTDSIKRVKIIEGKITIGVTNLLNLIPGPIGKVIPNLIKIDLNPIEFRWELAKYSIDASGPLDHTVTWFVYETDTVQSFNPMMIIKAKKGISKILAEARILYTLKTSLFHSEGHSKEKRISILPQ